MSGISIKIKLEPQDEAKVIKETSKSHRKRRRKVDEEEKIFVGEIKQEEELNVDDGIEEEVQGIQEDFGEGEIIAEEVDINRELEELETSKSPQQANQDPYKCQICLKQFATRQTLRKHLLIHSRPSTFECDECNKVFKQKSHLETHICIADRTCTHCSFIFRNACLLKLHMRKTHGKELFDDEFKCKKCGKNFKNGGALKRHLRSCVNRQKRALICDHCDAKFPRKTDIKVHMMKHAIYRIECKICHKKIRPATRSSHMALYHPRFEGKFECHLCLKVFKSSTRLKSHLWVHNNKGIKFTCDKCGRSLIGRNSLMKHLLRHKKEKEKSMRCDLCDYKTDEKEYMIQHMRIHNKKYQCIICDLKFATGFILKDHIKSHKNSREFSCKLCSKSFNTKNSLNTHVKTHDLYREKKFVCPLCNYKTFCKSTLKLHLKNHDKKFQCSFCPRKFPTDSHLKDHEKYHINPEPRRCKICNFEAAEKSGLRRHVYLMHSKRVKNKSCDLCSFKTDTMQSIRIHVKRHEKKFQCDICKPSTYHRNQPDLKRHSRKFHDDPNRLRCKICGLKLSNVSNLYSHEKLHDPNREKKFKCKKCNFAADRKHHIERHSKGCK